MTTRVTVKNDSSNTHSDRHLVSVGVLAGADRVQVASHSLAPGDSKEFYVYGGQALLVEEVPMAEKPSQGTQN